MAVQTPSEKTPRGRFKNALPTRNPPFVGIMREWFHKKAQTVPQEPLPTLKRSADDFRSEPTTGLRITWLGHSTSLVEIDGRRFLLDPVWADRVSPLPWMGPKRFFEAPLPLDELPRPDAVLISHDHYDHLDRRTVRQLAASGVPFVVPLGVGRRLSRWGVRREQITELDWWESTSFGPMTVTATPARHFSGRSPFMTDRDQTLWSGFAIVGPEHRVYYAGDTAMFEGFAEIGRALGPFDATLIEIGAYHRLWADLHLGPEQAIQAFHAVRGGLLIPVHWATFDLAMHSWVEPAERLLAEAARTGAKVVVPRPGQSVEPAAPPDLERWWPSLAWQTADEHPVVSLTAAPSSDSAPRTGAESLRVSS